jgi:hypothetical protein
VVGEQMSVGRISGPLLKANLLRDGVDLAFETSLLYLDVNSPRVGVNTISPAYDLDVNGYTRTTNLEVTTELSVGPNITISGNTVASSSGTLNLTPALGNSVVYQGILNVDSLQLTDNKIYTTGTNTNLEIRPDGNGILHIYADTTIEGDLTITGDLHADGDITIGGNITLGNQTSDTIDFVAGIASDIIPRVDNNVSLGTPSLSWKDLYAYNLFLGNIKIDTNTITTRSGNANLVLTANGSGSVSIEQLNITDYTISSNTNSDITLEPNGTGIVNISSTQSIKLPAGTTSERPVTPLAGMIRFNTDYNHYEGYDGSYWVALDGVYDVDRNTYITAELTPGANDNTIRFVADGTPVADLNSTRFNIAELQVDSININDNTISTTTSATDLNLSPNSGGHVVIGNLEISDTTIHNYVNDSVTTFTQSGTGYFKITGTTGFVMPYGGNDTRISAISTPLGLTRYNTDNQRVEIWDGTQWISIAGASGGITATDATEIAIQTVFRLG